MPSSRHRRAVSSDVGTAITFFKAPSWSRSARSPSNGRTVEPVPSPTAIPLSTNSSARAAAARFNWSTVDVFIVKER